MENLSTNIRNMTNQWKKMFDDEFFARLNNGYALITNFGAPTDANSSSSSLLPGAAAPSLLAAPRSGHASSHAAAGHPCSGHATKLVDNDAHLNNIEHAQPKVDATNDIHKVLDNWKKKFDEFFARRENSPPIADPPQPELTTLEIAYKGRAPSTTTPSSQLPQLIEDLKLCSGEICIAPTSTSAMLTPRMPTTSTSTMATATFSYINNLWYASYHLTGGA